MDNKIVVPEAWASMIVDCAGYENGHRVKTLALSDMHAWITGPEHFVWVGLHEPDRDLLQVVQQQFGLHELAIEDAFKAHQRPKLEFYGDSPFMVLHTARHVESKIEFGETYIFGGRGYVVAVRHGASSSYRELRSRCERVPSMLAKGTDFVIYSLMDFIVDNYLPIIDEMEDEADAIEADVLSSRVDRQMVQRVQHLRRRLRRLHSMTSPMVEICNRLVRFDSGLVDDDMRPYFRDVHDHVLRIDNRINALRDMLSSALEANIMIASMEQNEVMKKLAAYAAMLAIPTAIAGIYGMNFESIPELHWRYGYGFALGLMVGTCTYLYTRFKKAGWL